MPVIIIIRESIERYKHKFNNNVRCIGLQRLRLRVAGPMSAAGGDASTVSGLRWPHDTLISDDAAYLIPAHVPIV